MVFGIYELNIEEFKLCLPKPGDKQRPAKFSSPPGTDIAFMTFKRQKSD